VNVSDNLDLSVAEFRLLSGPPDIYGNHFMQSPGKHLNFILKIMQATVCYLKLFYVILWLCLWF